MSVVGHETDMPHWSLYVRSWGQSGKHMLAMSFSGFDPFRTWGIAGRRPTIVLYEHSISPSRGRHLEQRARRAATGGYSGGGCRGLLPLDRDRRRRHAGATESS